METIAFGDVRAEVVPERGALVTALRVGTRDVLYLDPETLADPTKNVRGGIPCCSRSPASSSTRR